MFGLLRNRFKMNGGHFRSHVWDPKLLCLQIVAMQCQFYFMFGMWTYLMDIIGRFDASMDQLFTQTVRDVMECYIAYMTTVKKTKQYSKFSKSITQ